MGHTESELKELARFLKSLPGETRVLMGCTGRYYEPIARYLHEAGIFVSVVNAILAHDYNGNSIQKVKTDKIDAMKLANMAIDRWPQLENTFPKMRSVYTYLDKKRSEGKPYGVYMITVANKFLRIYYARSKLDLVNT